MKRLNLFGMMHQQAKVAICSTDESIATQQTMP